MALPEIENDTRGWIMCIVSAIACMFGASIICVDIITHHVPSMRHFRIDKSHVFQSLAYSFSFGVLIFSSLCSIVPSSKKYLINGGIAPKTAGAILLAGFVGGFVAIMITTRLVHDITPSTPVDCHHTHQDEEEGHEHSHSHGQSRNTSNASRSRNRRPLSRPVTSNGRALESTPLLSNGSARKDSPHRSIGPFGADGSGHSRIRKSSKARKQSTPNTDRRPSMIEVRDRVMSFVTDTKTNCDSAGPCYGYSGLCGQQCLKRINPRAPGGSRGPPMLPIDLHFDPSPEQAYSFSKNPSPSSTMPTELSDSTAATRATSTENLEDVGESIGEDEDCEERPNHHHHIPDNPHTDISLQTSIAIALHKLPEGFMTYATNHANPDLGFSVFMALFVHNITEGFALALPIYLASGSRLKALIVAAIIGGAAQPAGAGIAALWFKIAGTEGHAPGSVAYGVMFAITAGVMTSVALMLFKEGMEKGHNHDSCIRAALLGMAVMAISNAFTS